MSKTRESLGIFWLMEELGVKIGHEEVDGFYLHSYWRLTPSDSTGKGIAKTIADFWPNNSIQIEYSPMLAEEYENIRFEVRILEWPDASSWKNLIERTLKTVIKSGGGVAWIGGEISYDLGNGLTYAAYSEETGLFIGGELDDEIRYLDEEQEDRLTLIYERSLRKDI